MKMHAQFEKYQSGWMYRLWDEQFRQVIEIVASREIAFGLTIYNPGTGDGGKRLSLHITLPMISVFIAIPFTKAWHIDDICESYGVSTHDRSLYLQWGSKTKFVPFPWAFKHYSTEVLNTHLEWVTKPGWGDPKVSKEWRREFRFVLDDGTVQDTWATVTMDRMRWRHRWLYWTSLFQKERTSIWADFDEPVGHGINSWKGGTCGAGVDIDWPRESIDDALNRLAQNRRIFR